MRLVGTNNLSLAATDLASFLGCRHWSALEKAAALGRIARPRRAEPLLDVLRERGEQHEANYVASLEREGRRVLDLREYERREERVARTIQAMHDGVDVIVQGALADDRWFGYADIIERGDRPSALGAWSYEVTDTKLSRHTRAGTLLQLGVYSDLIAGIQQLTPEHFSVVIPGEPFVRESYRVDDYAAYFRLVRRHLLDTVALDPEEIAQRHYPEPVEHCLVCDWWQACDDRRRGDDHLSLVANVTRLHRRELESRGITTLTGLARMTVPLTFKPSRGSPQTYIQGREQALVQLESRGRTPPLHKLRPIEEKKGLCRLPPPSTGDIFLDLEGDPFAVDGGREYLFGVVTLGPDGKPHYRAWWALDASAERSAFEQVMDLIMDARARDDNMHIYHYAPYEPAAFKRLMGRYATRADALDQLLREERFVDLYGVARQAMFAGVERYSIKNLETLYGFTREVELSAANVGRAELEQALELGRPDIVPREVFTAVEGYNRDDCVSTLALRNWLERLRADVEQRGTPVPRPGTSDEPQREMSEKQRERQERIAALRDRLLAGLPDEREPHSPEQARWLLAHLLDFHRREDKATWWEYYRLRDLPEEELPDEPKSIAGLEFVERVEVVLHRTHRRPTGSVVDRYTYPPQEMEISRGAQLKTVEGDFGELRALDRTRRLVDIKKRPSTAEVHPVSVFAHEFVSAAVIEDALFRLGERVADAGLAALDATPAGHLLLARPPRLRTSTFAPRPRESMTDFAVRVAGELDRTVLPIQGPPGSGKTYTGALMICSLVRAGKRVGVTAHSHKAIRKLLDEVAIAGRRLGLDLRLTHVRKQDDNDDEVPAERSAVIEEPENEVALGQLQNGDVHVLGGTAWLWSSPDAEQAVDVLFVDEAGQMSLANTLAVAQAADSLVLLGDPRQLDQPRKAKHPDGVGASALEHLLGTHKTIPDDRGIFLPTTWRLAPSICRFTSEVFYESRLVSRDGLDRQVLTGAGEFDGSGLWVVDVTHEGRSSACPEEVEVVTDLVRRLTAPGVQWVDKDGIARPLTGSDILIVAPYNAQVSRLGEALEGTGATAGTVDKFQGQERPVVIYSMTTSRPEDAPRGMEFLYSPNRLNVATSRARCAAILVASPYLFEPECRSPRQMKLANGVCRFRELARITEAAGSETDGTARSHDIPQAVS